jgi:hypothetical protein
LSLQRKYKRSSAAAVGTTSSNSEGQGLSIKAEDLSPRKNLIKQLIMKKSAIFANSQGLDSLQPPRSKSQPIMRTSEILDMDKRSVEFRNPYVDENESKFVKEPVPFGNPFRLHTRMKSQKVNVTGEINDEALLSSPKLEEERESEHEKGMKQLTSETLQGSLVLKRSRKIGIMSIFLYFY